MKRLLSHVAAAALGACVLAGASSARAQTLATSTPLVFDADDIRDTDAADASGRAHHDHALRLGAGTSLEVVMFSRDFDAMVAISGPGGVRFENDDGFGAGTDARLEFVAPFTGLYTFSATTYEPGSTGSYLLIVTPQGAAPPAPPAVVAPSPPTSIESETPVPDSPVERAAETSDAGRLFGVFVGVTHYPYNSEIFRGAEDATDLGASFAQRGRIRPGDAVVLTDDAATTAAIRDAIATMATRMTPRDTLLFYFGGHGGDGTLALPEGSLTAEYLGAVLDQVPGRTVITLDSCHAGSFRSVVERAPRRVGFFSSRASETSFTAQSVNASGWLIYYLIHAARGEAPAGADGLLQRRELEAYVRAGYRTHHAPQTLVVAAGPGARNATLW